MSAVLKSKPSPTENTTSSHILVKNMSSSSPIDSPSSRLRSIPLSMEAEGPSRPGEGKPRRHPAIIGKDFIQTFSSRVATLYDAFLNACTRYGQHRFLGWRPKLDNGQFGSYQFITYEETLERVKSLAAGLASLNVSPKTNIGLYSINRPEWVLSEYACYFNNFVTVPLYDTLGDDAIQHICNQTEMQVMVASNDKAFNILRLKEKLAHLKTIICMDDTVSDELSMKASQMGVELIRFAVLEQTGRESLRDPNPPAPSDLCTICYTSGTTGTPKGVMLPHAALVADAGAVLFLAGEGEFASPEMTKFLFKLGPDVVHLSYLPLAHVYERIVITTLAAVGATIGFYQGDVMKLMDDIAILRPTLFCTVPRLLNRIYDKVMGTIEKSGTMTRFLFNMAYKSKTQNLRKYGQFDHWLWDRLVFAKVRNRLGGRVNAILTGSAPVAPEVMDFLRVCFACEVYEGYGQTETSAGSTLTCRGDWISGQIGVPLPCNEIKLVDIPEMGYINNSEDGSKLARGEICIRGANCFTGYYKEPELTKDALDEDGWVHTGDVGEWDERGRLKIIDRKKNIFKLAQGEYISPEKVENIIVRNKYIAQAYVEGNSVKACLVAIVVPDFEVLVPWARENNLESTNYKELVKMTQVKELLLKELQNMGSRGSKALKGFEVPRDIYVEHELFTVDNDLMTSTMKLKRHQARKRYASNIEEMYSQMTN